MSAVAGKKKLPRVSGPRCPTPPNDDESSRGATVLVLAPGGGEYRLMAIPASPLKMALRTWTVNAGLRVDGRDLDQDVEEVALNRRLRIAMLNVREFLL